MGSEPAGEVPGGKVGIYPLTSPLEVGHNGSMRDQECCQNLSPTAKILKGLYDQTQAVPVEPPRTLAVPRSFDGLRAAVGLAESALQNLLERIQTGVNDKPSPEGKKDPPEHKSADCALARAIDEQTDRVLALVEVMQVTTGRVEL